MLAKKMGQSEQALSETEMSLVVESIYIIVGVRVCVCVR